MHLKLHSVISPLLVPQNIIAMTLQNTTSLSNVQPHTDLMALVETEVDMSGLSNTEIF